MAGTTAVEGGDPSETAAEALAAPMNRREALGKLGYVAPAIVALQVSKPGLGLGRSGAGRRRGNTRITKTNTSNQTQTVHQTVTQNGKHQNGEQPVTLNPTLTQTNDQENRSSR